MNENVTLRSNQRRALETLTTTGDITKAANAAGVTRQTVYRWLQEPDFKAALAEVESTALKTLSAELSILAREATGVIRQILRNKKAGSTVRLRAANSVLSNVLRFLELKELDERLTALEERLTWK